MPFTIKQTSQEKVMNVSSTGPVRGMNRKTLLQLLSPSDALLIENYFIRQSGTLESRKGSKKLAEVAANTNSINVFFKYTDNIYLIGYGTVLAAYNVTAKTITTIKSNFNTNLEDGVRYGAYAYTCSGTGEKIYRTSQILNYDGQTGNFSIGLVVTGAISGATALIIEDNDAGATGTLTLDNISGTFQDNETITDTSTGSATANGANTFTTTEISASPYCKRLAIWERRLIAGNIVRGTKSSKSKIIASQEDSDGTVPYFSGWSVSTNALAAFEINFARAGELNDMKVFDVASQSPIPQQLFVSYADGWAAYHREIGPDGSGTTIQNVVADYSRLNTGGTGKMCSTPFGIFLGNETGEYIVRTDGTWRNLSETWDNINMLDQSNSDRVYLPHLDLVLITTRDDSEKNNIVYWFDTRTIGSKKISWGKITGWAVSRFLLDGLSLFGGGENNPKILSLLAENIYDDEGVDIFPSYTQPLNVGALTTVKDLRRIDVAGFLTPDNPITVHIDGISEQGSTSQDLITLDWEASEYTAGENGYGYSEYGYDGIGDAEDNPDGTLWYPAHDESHKAYGYTTYVVRLTSNTKVPHVVSFISIDVVEFRSQRANLLTASS